MVDRRARALSGIGIVSRLLLVNRGRDGRLSLELRAARQRLLQLVPCHEPVVRAVPGHRAFRSELPRLPPAIDLRQRTTALPWVEDRPEEIGEHAPVPIVSCAECHIPRIGFHLATISSTAGHRVHLEGTLAPAGVTCVTCPWPGALFRAGPIGLWTVGMSRSRQDTIAAADGRQTGSTASCASVHGSGGEDVPLDTARAALVPRARKLPLVS